MLPSKLYPPRHRLAFIASACSLVVIYAISSAPIPLYAGYSLTIGLTSSDLAMTSAFYFAGTVAALLIFARISNHVGRKPVALATTLLAALSCFIFFRISNSESLFIGRFLQGFSCGLASSAIAAYAMDTAPISPDWLGASVVSGAPMIGLGVGAFGAGILNEYTSGLASLIFVILIFLLILCALMLLFSPETVSLKKGALTSFVPKILIPKQVRRAFPAAMCTFIGTWAIGGMYQSFSSIIATQQLKKTDTILAAAVFASVMVPNLFGGSLSGRLTARNSQRVGMLLFLIFVAGAIYALHFQATIFFIVASMGAGFAWGAAFSGAMRTLLQGISQQDRAGVLSAVFFISYLGAAIPNLIIAKFAGSYSLMTIMIGYLCLVFLMCALTFLLSPKTKL